MKIIDRRSEVKTFVFKVTTTVYQEWAVEANSEQEALEILFNDGFPDENTKTESVDNITFIGTE